MALVGRVVPIKDVIRKAERLALGDLKIDVIEGNDASPVEFASDMFEGN